MPDLSPTRREFLQNTSLGFGALALSCLLETDRARAATHDRISHELSPRLGHFTSQAKSVIMLFQNGGASQMDLFEPKPELQRRHGEMVSHFRGGPDAKETPEPLMGSKFRFRPRGQSGIEFSELVPHLSRVVDDLCVVRSMYSNDPNHPGATYMMCSCNNRPGRPTMGAWVTYALGSENQNLPGYVLLRPPGVFHSGGAMQMTNGWLPAIYRGTELRSEGDPVLNLRRADTQPPGTQQNSLQLLGQLNQIQRQRFPDESVLDARIKNYELAARMQLTAAAELDLSSETKETQLLYGLDNPETAPYGRQLMLARRLVERGVRFVQVLSPGGHNVWDHHSKLNDNLPAICRRTDLPAAALLTDLKRRGLLDQTIVIWTGEFGRLPTAEGKAATGRGHNPNGFTLLLAGGGLKGGYVHGATDEFGYAATEDRVGVPDLMATVLNQLGLDHERLTFNVHATNETLTDAKVTGASVVRDLFG